MTNTKYQGHTPGPWEESGTRAYLIRSAEYGNVAFAEDSHARLNAERRANAALIAAAPALLARVEELEAALRWFTTRTSHKQSERETYKVAAAFINIARAALAEKA